MNAPEGGAAPSIDAALREGLDAGLERLDAQLLLADLLGRGRAWLISHGDDRLDDAMLSAWRARVHRSVAGEPLAYLLGRQEFFGLELQVNPQVLVPRADTETLVRWALAILQSRDPEQPAPAVVDLGTGSGAIALAIRHGHPRACVTAVDASLGALQVAQANGRRLGLEVEWRAGDWWSGVDQAGCFDLAVANPPYIAADDPHLRALRSEPIEALASGPDGLDDLRTIIGGAMSRLRPGAWLLLEHGHEQAPGVSGLLAAAGFSCIETRPDLAGRPRCTGGMVGLNRR